MIIQQHAWSVGSLSGADPNAHSFQSAGDHRHPKKKTGPESPESDAGVTLTTQPGYHGQSDIVREQLGEAISFSQTQDAFLSKVHNALDRMRELSSRVSESSSAPPELAADQIEFAALQTQIDDCRAKMRESAQVFHAVWPTSTEGPLHASIEPRQLSAVLGFQRNMERLHDPSFAGTAGDRLELNSAEVIQGALTATQDLRTEMAENLRQLEKAREVVSASDERNDSTTANRITDQGCAVESTQLARFNMLAKSSAAMLAQANAVPQSTLRLLE